MEPKLSTYNECCDNIGLFAKININSAKNGLFVSSHNYDVPFCFYWLYNNEFHRLDGPARIYFNGDRHWCFGGELIYVYSQEEFDRWLASNS